MHVISSYHGNRPTNTPTDRNDYNTLHRNFASGSYQHALTYHAKFGPWKSNRIGVGKVPKHGNTGHGPFGMEGV